jgi:transposase
VFKYIDDNLYSINVNNDVINSKINSLGFFTLFSNYIKDPKEAIKIYRNKDVVEKGFHNLKNRLKFKRTMSHSDTNLDSYAFLNYLSLILLFYIHKKMRNNNLYKNYSLDMLLKELDLITKYINPDHSYHFGEITKKQIDFYKYLDINPLLRH